MDDLELSKKLVSAMIDHGQVWVRHGIVFSGDSKEIMSEAELVEALKLCEFAGIRIEQVGGERWPSFKLIG
jgi:hypothetical protein